MSGDESYLLVDDALIRLRRLWTGMAPSAATTSDRSTPVEMSTVLVVDAIHRLQVTQPQAEVTVAASLIASTSQPPLPAASLIAR